jgi:protein tyrosine phosphatase (PTP) superfamily phosphohydrolase (DUF442 family)
MKLHCIFAFLVLAAGCGQQAMPPATSPPPSVSTPPSPASTSAPRESTANIEKIEAKHLPNPVRVTAGVISGGLPEGDAAFAELKDLGVKTIISVDGAKPDVATAEKYGLRYVHLPHGYDGIPEDRARLLAKGVRDLPRPIYVHCHHGKHRSPAAAAVACLGAGLIGQAEATQVLKVAGTGENYLGLFQSVERTQPLGKAVLDQVPADFPATAKIPVMAEAMIEIEHIHDRLKAIEKAGWKTPADQPALARDHEALLLREQFTELLRVPEMKDRPEGFRQLTGEAETLALALEEGLKSTIEPEVASKLFLAVSNNCKTCHREFRDRPSETR